MNPHDLGSHGPQPCASASSATSAYFCYIFLAYLAKACDLALLIGYKKVGGILDTVIYYTLFKIFCKGVFDIMQKNIDKVCEYSKAQEKAPDNLRMGVEFEQLLLDSQANARSYYDAGGSRDLFLAMIDKGWKGNFEGEFVLSIKKDGLIISTEPGGQLEFSTDPLENPCEVK